MTSTNLLSWGRFPYHPQTSHPIYWPEDVQVKLGIDSIYGCNSVLAFGCGRSYGDSCLAVSGNVLAMQGMDRILSVDWAAGIVFAQAGLTLAELINLAIPHGWFLPVSPGTKFVTLGGAVANDVHGKNHHTMGTFGQHIIQLLIHRSDEGVVDCSLFDRPDLFAATVGGLGMTGVIVGVKIQLRKIVSNKINQRSIRFGNLDEFFELSGLLDEVHEYSVAWIDCISSGKRMGRGRYVFGDHAKEGLLEALEVGSLSVPFTIPFSPINRTTLRVFNGLYYQSQQTKMIDSTVTYDSFFYPLDQLHHWNRIYGRAGFQQYQCVIPEKDERDVISEIMRQISRGGSGSFLAVLKKFGSSVSPGLMSFPMRGLSLALDFPQRDQANKRLFEILDNLVHEAGGRLYPAKDAHMSGVHFKQAYPNWNKVEALRDPKLLSHFWSRVAL